MPRVNHIKKARDDQGRCGKCGDPLPAGCAYRWWKFRYGGKRKRCMKPGCAPRRSDLTTSAFWGAIYSAQEAFTDADKSTPENAADALREMAESLREAGEIRTDAADNIEDGFGHPTYQSDELREEGDSITYWADEVESAADDLESEAEDEDRDGDVEDMIDEKIAVADECPV